SEGRLAAAEAKTQRLLDASLWLSRLGGQKPDRFTARNAVGGVRLYAIGVPGRDKIGDRNSCGTVTGLDAGLQSRIDRDGQPPPGGTGAAGLKARQPQITDSRCSADEEREIDVDLAAGRLA